MSTRYASAGVVADCRYNGGSNAKMPIDGRAHSVSRRNSGINLDGKPLIETLADSVWFEEAQEQPELRRR